MKPFKIVTDVDKMASINRTIRLKPEIFGALMEISEATGCLRRAMPHALGLADG